MGDDDRSHTQGVGEAPNQVARDAQGNRVESGEGLVIKNEAGFQGNRPRQGHTARHATGKLRGHEFVRPAQPHRVQLHQHQIADHFLREVGVLAQRKGDVVEYRQVGEQGAELEQHTHAPSQPIQPILIQAAHVDAIHLEHTRSGAQSATDQPQQRGLATPGDTHDGNDLTAPGGEVDILEHGPFAVGEREIADLDEIV